MLDASNTPGGAALRRFRRRGARLVEIEREAKDLIDYMVLDIFDIDARYVEPVAASLAREAAIVADLLQIRKVLQRTAWLCIPIDLPRIDLAKRCLDDAKFSKVRLAHIVLDGRGEHEDGLIWHPIHNRLTHVVAAVGGKSVFRDYYQKGILPLADRMPHEAATVELILRHSGEGDIVGIRDGLLADVLESFELARGVEPARPPRTGPRQ